MCISFHHRSPHAQILCPTDGSIAINLINGPTLPTLYFHDDESRSFCLPPRSPPPRPTSPATYPPPPSSPQEQPTSWGGEDLIARLRSYSHILRSCLDPALLLIDPSRADVEAHTTILFGDDEVDDVLAQSSYANSFSPIPAHRRPRPISTSTPNPYSSRSSVLHRSMAAPLPSMSQGTSQARMALLQSFSNITRATKHAAQNILSHPLAKPIVPHLPDPVKSLVNANGEWEWGSWVEKGGVGEFESARVYLARWARVVAEEGERARRREAQAIPSSSEDAGEESSSLGIFELLHNTSNLPTPKTTRDPKHPVDTGMWLGWFDSTGRPNVSKEEMRKEVFRRGISTVGDLRRTVWPFLLGVYEWDTTTEERDRLWEEKRYAPTSARLWARLSRTYTGSGTTNSETNGVVYRRFSRDKMCWRRDIASTWTAAARIGPYLCLHNLPHLPKTKLRRLDTLSFHHRMVK